MLRACISEKIRPEWLKTPTLINLQRLTIQRDTGVLTLQKHEDLSKANYVSGQSEITKAIKEEFGMEISWWAELLHLNELITKKSLSAAVFMDRSTRQYLKSLANSSREPNQEIWETKVKHINITEAY